MEHAEAIPSGDDLENLLCGFMDANDSRVRARAAATLLEACKNGWTLPRQHYELVGRLTKDSAETVRLLGLRLIHIYASTPAYVDTLVPSGANNEVEIRLVDHAFTTLCNAMHDLSVTVRTEAASLLGSLKNVNEKFLEQTLDKKLMSKMRFTKTSIFSRSGQQQQGISEWSTGRKFGEDVPMEKAEEDSESLMPSGACGAFVTGLEDEYSSVRNASIDAISNLAAGCPSFAQNALDFLADMFNDEIEEVRLNAIKSLRHLCNHIVLKVDQMEIILNALDDAAPDSREALRELLCVCTMADVPCLRMIVKALLNNLKRYSADRQSIWRCMKCIGTNHAALTMPLVADLLDLHPFFETNEPALEDHFYIAKLILVLNVAAKCPPVKALFLGHTWRHYHYLRNSSPHLVPNLDTVTETSSIVLDKNAERMNTRETLTRCQNLLASCVRLDGKIKWEVMKLVIEDLKLMADSITGTMEQDSEDEATASGPLMNVRWRAECLRYCAENVMQLDKLLRQLTVDYQLFGNTASAVSLAAADGVKEILKNSFALEHLWKTVTPAPASVTTEDKHDIVALACDLRLRSVVALMALNVNNDDQRDSRRWLSLFLTTLEKVSKYRSNEAWVSELAPLTDDLSCDNAATKAPDILYRLAGVPLSAALDGSGFGDVRKKRASIMEPDKNNDMVVRFVSGLAASIKLTATFYDLDDADLENVRVRVVYPDQRDQFIKPRPSHFRRLSPSICRLRTEVLVSDYSWSGPARIDLSLVYRLTSDTFGGGEQENDMDALSWLNLDTASEIGVSVKLYPKARC